MKRLGNYLIIPTLLYVLIIDFQNGFTQTVRAFEKAGDKAYVEGDFYGASLYYKQGLDKDLTSLKMGYKYADASRLYNNYLIAEKWYKKVYSSDKGKKYPHCEFWYGLMQKSNGKYADARKTFKRFANANRRDTLGYYTRAKHEIEACDHAVKLMADTLPVTIKNLGTNVNSAFTEFGAYQVAHNITYYSALRPDSMGDEVNFDLDVFAKLYVTIRDGQEWVEGKTLDTLFNTAGMHVGNISFTKNYERFYFTKCLSKDILRVDCEVYFSDFDNGTWKRPVRLNDSINLPGYTATHPCVGLAIDGKEYLYFVSNRPGGQGNFDIWSCVINENGTYGKPRNLGPIVNTPENEVAPFYHSLTKRLFFSSDWHKGLGGYDIFRSKQENLNEWSEPENIGYPLNTSANDLFFTINKDTLEGYLTSNRPGSIYYKGETCCNDIYAYKWPKPEKPKRDRSGFLADGSSTSGNNGSSSNKFGQTTSQLRPVVLYFHNDEPECCNMRETTSIDYMQSLKDYIRLEDKYRAEFAQGLSGKRRRSAEEEIGDFFQNHIKMGASRIEEFAKNLIVHLESGYNVIITFKGYCSPLTSNEYNINLSKRRIASIKNYFYNYKRGSLRKYLTKDSKGDNKSGTGWLTFREVALGEEKANPQVSDDQHDLRNSVYSKAAALERKIEIIPHVAKPSN